MSDSQADSKPKDRGFWRRVRAAINYRRWRLSEAHLEMLAERETLLVGLLKERGKGAFNRSERRARGDYHNVPVAIQQGPRS